MPLRKDSRVKVTGAVVAALLAATALAPAAQAACVEQPTTKAFAKFGDNADYAVAPGGNFEGSLAGWTLLGAVRVVDGNDGANVLPGSKSLLLGPGSLVISPEFCVDETHPYFRYMLKPYMFGANMSTIIQYKSADGASGSLWLQAFSAMNLNILPGTWKPSSFNPLAVNIPLVQYGSGKAATVRIMFSSTSGFYNLDNVMVDPYRSR